MLLAYIAFPFSFLFFVFLTLIVWGPFFFFRFLSTFYSNIGSAGRRAASRFRAFSFFGYYSYHFLLYLSVPASEAFVIFISFFSFFIFYIPFLRKCLHARAMVDLEERLEGEEVSFFFLFVCLEIRRDLSHIYIYLAPQGRIKI
ncbi:hypothetical protein DFH27DRAFT_184933 [Peziza echinospora]|nr:hypothetical protein DFH27DRAFT_184933 [Peziza echinospora]